MNRKTRRTRRVAGRSVLRFVRRAVYSRREAILADLRTLGLDSIKAGIAALVLNTWLRNAILVYAAFTALGLGLVLWTVGLPPKRPAKRKRE